MQRRIACVSTKILKFLSWHSQKQTSTKHEILNKFQNLFPPIPPLQREECLTLAGVQVVELNILPKNAKKLPIRYQTSSIKNYHEYKGYYCHERRC
ncbi:hypothetical protein KSMBR1_2500 [Candidatus Kuenenia stuttgartiensis]|nr:hypothetical protein KSMBR1_2500 [Candidatus Kuenenia stuttgartiensis]